MTTERRSTRKQKLSRREVLKALAAIGGAAAASALLPEKWIEPVVEAGVLPAHAQSSSYIVHCHIHDLAFRRDPGGTKEWVPAAGNFRLEVLGQVVPPVAGLSMQIEFAVKRPYHDANTVFPYSSTRDTDPSGIVSSGPLQVTILSGDGVYFTASLPGKFGYCGDEILVP